MSRELWEGLAYLQAVATAMYFLRQVGADIQEAEVLGVPEACERLAEAEPASCEGWRLLGRVPRHVLATMEESGDARSLLVHELHATVMAHADRAALVRQNGE